MSVVYESTLLISTGKKGVLRCDADGYYDVTLGAFNTYNSSGAFYDAPSAKAFFDEGHDFMRRIKAGALYGECGHPVPVPGMSKTEWLVRILTIDPRNTSHHIKSLEIDETSFKNKDGSPMVAVMGRVKPMIEKLAASLENPHENTAFSIRSITNDAFCPRRGCMVKHMKKPVTYDYVIEPGIAIATKYNTPSLESLGTNAVFTDGDIDRAIDLTRKTFSGMESDSLVQTLESLRERAIDNTRPKPIFLGRARRPASAFL